jgi:hypothetical protein
LTTPRPRRHQVSGRDRVIGTHRLRLHGLIQRIPGTHTYTGTPDGIRVAIFYTKLHHRLLGPLLAAGGPPAPPELRAALATIDHAVAGYVTTARLGKAA